MPGPVPGAVPGLTDPSQSSPTSGAGLRRLDQGRTEPPSLFPPVRGALSDRDPHGDSSVTGGLLCERGSCLEITLRFPFCPARFEAAAEPGSRRGSAGTPMSPAGPCCIPRAGRALAGGLCLPGPPVPALSKVRAPEGAVLPWQSCACPVSLLPGAAPPLSEPPCHCGALRSGLASCARALPAKGDRTWEVTDGGRAIPFLGTDEGREQRWCRRSGMCCYGNICASSSASRRDPAGPWACSRQQRGDFAARRGHGLGLVSPLLWPLGHPCSLAG